MATNQNNNTENTIFHGDAGEILKTFKNESVDLIVTDPPYGDNMGYGRHLRTIAHNEHPLTGLAVLYDCYRLLRKNSNAYVFLDIKHLPIIRQFIEHYTRYNVREWVVWDKVYMGMGYGFRKQHELILVLEKGTPKYRNKGFPNVLNEKRVNTKDHVHQKPERLIRQLIEQSSDVGDTVLDPFVGSGTTCVAAQTLGRTWIGFEREKEYVEIAKARIQNAKNHTRPVEKKPRG